MSDHTFFSSVLSREWLEVVLEECNKEGKESHIKLVPHSARTFLWNISDTLDLKFSGVAGLACRILESYLQLLRVRFANIEDPRLRNEKIEEVRSQMAPITTCCILLSSKMNSSVRRFNYKMVRHQLLCHGIHLEVKDIIATEMKIFSTLNFKIPFWNTLDHALFLASYSNMLPLNEAGIELIVDLADYYKDIIESEIRSQTSIPPEFRRQDITNVRTVHLAAAAVAAASLFSQTSEIIDTFTTLLKVPRIYLQYLCGSIMTQLAIPERPHYEQLMNSKRKLDFFDM